MTILERMPKSLTKEEPETKGNSCIYSTVAQRENRLSTLSERNPLYACLNCTRTRKESQFLECTNYTPLKR
jgi:hypothetical protein